MGVRLMRLIQRSGLVILVVLAWGCARSEEPPAAGRGGSAQTAAAGSPFLVEPYLQWGGSPDQSAAPSLEVHWQTDDSDGQWSVEYALAEGQAWREAEPPAMRKIVVPPIEPHRLYRASLKELPPGGRIPYRLRKAGTIVFGSQAIVPKTGDSPYRFAVFGDCGANTKEQRAVAFQAYAAQPDFVMITGDIVYSRGRISEYREKFWPIYNANGASPALGGPLMRSTVFLTAPGNHDISSRDLGKYPDGLAYFLYWSQPLNGPTGEEGGHLVPPLVGPEANTKAFKDAAGPAYPRMSNYSFNYGNSHWTVLDANSYVDWTDPKLLGWVKADLASANRAAWRFVAFHQPGFNSSKAHFGIQNMRLLAESFEEGKVDVVFSGHVHNYQRTLPLHFVADREPTGGQPRNKELVPGRWRLDRAFDGRNVTRADGVIYLVTGAGGARLYNPEQQDDPTSWQEFTCKFVSKVHSLTVAEVEGPRLTIRQVALDGKELDRFVVTK